MFRFTFPNRPSRHRSIQELIQKVDQLMSGQADLNAALSKLQTTVTAVGKALAAGASGTSTADDAAFENFAEQVDSITTQLQDALNGLGSGSGTGGTGGSPTSLALSPTTLPDATVGVAYSESLTVSGGTAPYVFTPTVQGGIALSTDGGLSGTANTAGPLSFPVSVVDSSSPALNLTATLTLNVDAAAA
jgi:hypothetical protein